MSDRIFAVVWLFVLAATAWVGWRIEAQFSYEPIGPRAYPLLLCGLMAAGALRLLFKPDPQAHWPRGALGVKVAGLLMVLFAWSLLFEPLGFILATALSGFAIARLFDAPRIPSAACAIALAVVLYFFFDKLLDVNLPLGRLFTA